MCGADVSVAECFFECFFEMYMECMESVQKAYICGTAQCFCGTVQWFCGTVQWFYGTVDWFCGTVQWLGTVPPGGMLHMLYMLYSASRGARLPFGRLFATLFFAQDSQR